LNYYSWRRFDITTSVSLPSRANAPFLSRLSKLKGSLIIRLMKIRALLA